MKSIKKIFLKKDLPNSQKLVNNLFKDLRFHAKTDLSDMYKKLLKSYAEKGKNVMGFIEELASRTKEKMKIHQMIKLFTLIHSLIIDRDYSEE